jgi:hypothetical protein
VSYRHHFFGLPFLEGSILLLSSIVIRQSGFCKVSKCHAWLPPLEAPSLTDRNLVRPLGHLEFFVPMRLHEHRKRIATDPYPRTGVLRLAKRDGKERGVAWRAECESLAEEAPSS